MSGRSIIKVKLTFIRKYCTKLALWNLTIEKWKQKGQYRYTVKRIKYIFTKLYESFKNNKERVIIQTTDTSFIKLVLSKKSHLNKAY